MHLAGKSHISDPEEDHGIMSSYYMSVFILGDSLKIRAYGCALTCVCLTVRKPPYVAQFLQCHE
jgi:hypothetical protein